MITETPSVVAHLPLRAVVAQLRLQLRAVQRDAEDAEAEAAEAAARLDHSAARVELRSKLDRLVAERREELAAALAAASSEAASTIATAHAEASAILAAAAEGDEAFTSALASPPLIAELPLFEDERPEFLGFTTSAPMPRASRSEIARLKLQLRAALDEASAAEAEGIGWDLDAAVSALRARLGRLTQDRREAMAEELQLGRASAVAAEATARQDAALLISGAWSLTGVQAEGRPWLRAESSSVFDVVPWLRTDDHPRVQHRPELADAALDEILDDLELEPWITGPTPVIPPADSLFAPPQSVVDDALADRPAERAASMVAATAPTGSVVIDAEGFARAVAVAVAAVLEDRDRREPGQQAVVQVAPQAPMPWYSAGPPATWSGGTGPVPWWAAPPPAPAKKKSFWADAWHADVLLWLVALGIALVVLLAWVA